MHKFYTIFFMWMSMFVEANASSTSSEDSWQELSDDSSRRSSFELSYQSSEDTSDEYMLTSSDEYYDPSDLRYSSSEEDTAKPLPKVNLGITTSPQTRVKKLKKQELLFQNKEIPVTYPKKAQSPIGHANKDVTLKPVEITSSLPKKIQRPIAQYVRTHQIKMLESDESSSSESSGHSDILSLSSDSLDSIMN